VTVLLLRLAGPLQSWGSSSRFVRRTTEDAPTKSGIIGLLAAAQGRRHSDPIEDLANIRLGVRIDQPGTLLRDFQSALKPGEPNPSISNRYYLTDAAFLVALEGDRALLEGMTEALRRPVFQLSLGRRSCPPVGPLVIGLRDHGLESVLRGHSWVASTVHQKKNRDRTIRLATVTDCAVGTAGSEVLRDEPISFDPVRREYGWRSVLRCHVTIDNPFAPAVSLPEHDPMAALEFPCT
jgi:CRISPR system Cascade subunit CasD